MIFQRAPSDCPNLSIISQWSSSDLHSHHGLRKVLTQFKTIFQWSPREAISQRMLNELSMNTQWTLNDRSRSIQWSHRSLNDLSVIFQWMPICPPRRRNGWEINECTRISHRMVSVLCKEPLTSDKCQSWKFGRNFLKTNLGWPEQHAHINQTPYYNESWYLFSIDEH